MAAQIVHNDEIPGPQGRQQTLFDVGQEAGAVDRAVKDTRGGEAIMAQRRHEGQRVPVPLRPGSA